MHAPNCGKIQYFFSKCKVQVGINVNMKGEKLTWSWLHALIIIMANSYNKSRKPVSSELLKRTLTGVSII